MGEDLVNSEKKSVKKSTQVDTAEPINLIDLLNIDRDH